MNVTVAKSAGFCFGVKRAVDIVYEAAEKADEPVYTYGPIIHNREVIRNMEEKGVCVVENTNDFAALPRGTVIIRSHGISRAEEESLKNSGFHVIDATCPFVKKIHRYVEKYSRMGYHLIVTGNPKHPEVQGICGWNDGPAIDVISSEADFDALKIDKNDKLCLVSQTTFNLKFFAELVEIIKQKGYDIFVLNTICDATEKRQTEAAELARNSDAMIVIGDPGSSNTQKLFEISKNECENTYYIQTSSNMDFTRLRSINNVGITAGASTPNYIIEEVSKNVRNEL